jgi:hypothetical protein
VQTIEPAHDKCPTTPSPYIVAALFGDPCYSERIRTALQGERGGGAFGDHFGIRGLRLFDDKAVLPCLLGFSGLVVCDRAGGC